MNGYATAKLTAYSKCSKNLNTFHSILSYKMLVISAGIHKIDVKNRETANSTDPDQTAAEAV